MASENMASYVAAFSLPAWLVIEEVLVILGKRYQWPSRYRQRPDPLELRKLG